MGQRGFASVVILTASAHGVAFARLLEIFVGAINLCGQVSDTQRQECKRAGSNLQLRGTGGASSVGNGVNRASREKHTIKLVREGIVVLGLRSAGTWRRGQYGAYTAQRGHEASQ